MGKLGWSLPPGVTSLPGDCQGPCEVCGKSIDECICPECPVCHSYGDPNCYSDTDPEEFPQYIPDQHHGLTRTDEQKRSFEEYCKYIEKEEKYAEEWLKSLEESIEN